MTSKDNGPTTSVSERMQAIDQALDDYEKRIGLPVSTKSDEADRFLTMGQDQLNALQPEECAEAAVLLNQLAYRIQKAQNKENARIAWASGLINRSVAKRISQYRGGSFQHQENQAIINDAYTKKLDEIRSYAKQRSERLAFLSTNVREVATSLQRLQMAKERREK